MNHLTFKKLGLLILVIIVSFPLWFSVYRHVFQSDSIAYERNELRMELSKLLDEHSFQYESIDVDADLKIRKLAFTQITVADNSPDSFFSMLRKNGYTIVEQYYDDNNYIHILARTSQFIVRVIQKDKRRYYISIRKNTVWGRNEW